MSRVITFSRHFQKSHPKSGEPTYFVEKIHRGLLELGLTHPEKINNYYGDWKPYSEMDYWRHEPKYHTIRSGHRFKVGDKFSPRVWSGKPYASKQIIIAPDIEVKKVWDLSIEVDAQFHKCKFYLNGDWFCAKLWTVAINDGLAIDDFLRWFLGDYQDSTKRKPFYGQIICWNENIEY